MNCNNKNYKLKRLEYTGYGILESVRTDKIRKDENV